jgi:hypothetical protein
MTDIILIGNGGSALDLKCGEEIDKIPKVCRFNKFYLGKWSKYVGARTTHWVTYWGYRREVEEYDEILSTCYLSKKRFQRFKRKYPLSKVFPKDVLERTKDEMGYEYPSAGAFALTYFVHNTDFNNIAIYGFDHFSNKKHHYAGNKGYLGHHNSEKEKEFFETYLQDGIIKRFK